MRRRSRETCLTSPIDEGSQKCTPEMGVSCNVDVSPLFINIDKHSLWMPPVPSNSLKKSLV